MSKTKIYIRNYWKEKKSVPGALTESTSAIPILPLPAVVDEETLPGAAKALFRSCKEDNCNASVAAPGAFFRLFTRFFKASEFLAK